MTRGIKEILESEKDVVEQKRKKMFISLLKAIDSAGGDAKSFQQRIVNEDLTVIELIDSLAQNDITFVYTKKTDEA